MFININEILNKPIRQQKANPHQPAAGRLKSGDWDFWKYEEQKEIEEEIEDELEEEIEEPAPRRRRIARVSEQDKKENRATASFFINVVNTIVPVFASKFTNTKSESWELEEEEEEELKEKLGAVIDKYTSFEIVSPEIALLWAVTMVYGGKFFTAKIMGGGASIPNSEPTQQKKYGNPSFSIISFNNNETHETKTEPDGEQEFRQEDTEPSPKNPGGEQEFRQENKEPNAETASKNLEPSREPSAELMAIRPDFLLEDEKKRLFSEAAAAKFRRIQEREMKEQLKNQKYELIKEQLREGAPAYLVAREFHVRKQKVLDLLKQVRDERNSKSTI